jgi:hypothetical protein
MPVAALVYILIMPSLSGYLQLSIVIFAYIFWAQYSLVNPLAQLAGMFGFLNLMPIANEQTYSFITVAIGYLLIIGCMLVVIGCAYVLGSPRPEKMFMRMIRRYFHSADYVLQAMARPRGQRSGWLNTYRLAFHTREISSLPAKLQLWGGQIRQHDFPANSPAQIELLINGLAGLSYRLEELLALKDVPQAPLLANELFEQIHSWRAFMQQGFAQIARGDGAAEAESLIAGLNERLAGIEQSMDAVLASLAGEQLGETELEHAYKLLGAYRGVASAATAWIAVAQQVNWAQWHEEVFS